MRKTTGCWVERTLDKYRCVTDWCYWSAGGESPVARLAFRPRGADHTGTSCVSVTLPQFFTSCSQKVRDFAAGAALAAAMQSSKNAEATRFLVL